MSEPFDLDIARMRRTLASNPTDPATIAVVAERMDRLLNQEVDVQMEAMREAKAKANAALADLTAAREKYLAAAADLATNAKTAMDQINRARWLGFVGGAIFGLALAHML